LRGAREGDLVAQTLHEGHFDLLAVELAGEVEKVRLEYALAATERRSDAERRGRFEASLPHLGPHRVDPVAREATLLRQREVDGGKPERAAALVAMHDTAADAVRPAQKTRRRLDIARQKKIADACGADDRPVELDR